MLLGYFMRHKSVHILSKIDQVDLLSDHEAAVVLFAGLAGSPQEAEMTPPQWRGDLLRIELFFKLNDDNEWRLQMAEWRRAAAEDFSL
jgi:hypothetical protein